jgi:hypothetical protein
LKLQTTFDNNKKPPTTTKRHSASKPQHPNPHPPERPHSHDADADAAAADDDDEDGDLTARPRSAIHASFASLRWTATLANGISIDEMLLHGVDSGGGGGGGGSIRQHRRGDSGGGEEMRQLPSPQAQERVGPTTPNGYDDISPITRGEWGFLMFGKGRVAGVEMC